MPSSSHRRARTASGLSQQIVAAARGRHADLGAPFVLDVGSNACTGFMYALAIGSSVMQALAYRRVAAWRWSSRRAALPTTRWPSAPARCSAMPRGVLLARDVRGIATLRSVRASSMIDAETIGMVKGSGMQAAHLALEVPKSARWFMSAHRSPSAPRASLSRRSSACSARACRSTG